MWAVSAWWNVGSDYAPYLVPVDAVRSMGHVDDAVRRVLVLHVLRAEVNDAWEAHCRHRAKVRELWGVD